MPAATLRFDFDPPLKEFHFLTSRFGEEISDFSGLFRFLGGMFRADMALQFQSEGGASGGNWEQLSELYGSWKAKKYPGRKIGELTGALKASMTGGAGYTEIVTPTTAEFGQADGATPTADGSYGRFFNDGTSKMTARPILRMTAEWGTEWQKSAQIWLVERWKAAKAAGEF